MPAETKATTLFSLGVVKSHLGIRSDNTDKDSDLVRMADGISERIEKLAGRLFVIRNVVERYDGTGSDNLFLRHFPVVSVNELKTRWTLFDSFQTVLATDYEVDTAKGILMYRGIIGPNHSFPDGRQLIELDVDYGWDDQDGEDLPQDIYLSALDWVKFEYTRWSTGMIMMSSASDGGRSFSISPKPPADVMAACEQYRRVRFL